MSCIWLCIGATCAGFFAGGLLVLLMARLPIDKHTALRLSQAFATSSPPSRSARALLHPAEHIGSALKRGVNVCQRQTVNEVFGPLVTKFVRNFGREGATPIQRGSQAIKFIRHNTSPIFKPPHIESWVAYCAHQVQSFDLDQKLCRGFNEQIFG